MAIYLDYAATSPMRPAVIEAYAAALSVVGNPASIHSQGQQAKRMLEEAREQVAASLGADHIEVTFTSGGTEAVNLAVKGLFWRRNGVSTGSTLVGAPAAGPAFVGEPAAGAAGAAASALATHTGSARAVSRPRILATRAEHHATIDAVEWLVSAQGASVDWIPVDALGRIDLAALERALGDDVALVSTLWANNEVGTIQPIAEIVTLAARHGVPVHADAVAAYGSLPIDFHASGLAALSVSAHKIGGPVGIGALLVARSETVVPLIHGGNQQRFRSGTQDAAGAVAFAAASAAAVASLTTPVLSEPDLAHAPAVEVAPVPEPARLRRLRDRLVAGIRTAVPDAVYRGDPSAQGRLPGNAHFTFPGCEGDSLLFLLDMAGFSVSTGSACQAGVPEASHVLLAMGVPEQDARGALRITLGHETTQAEVDAFVAALPAAVARARAAGFADREVARGR